ncbi:MAG: PASTA domain-containing protein [Clostridia bacterium]|nr:PASTA domain-containing protein [Clostridia bacterium]
MIFFEELAMASLKPRKTHIREILTAVAFVLVAVIAAGRLFYLQIVSYDKFKNDTSGSISSETGIKASRGLIVDANGVVLADNRTVERVFISPADMKSDAERQLVAENLSRILEVDYDTVYEKTLKKKRKDETIKKNVEKEEADLVRAFINRYDLESVHLVTSSTRYYPFENFLSHTLGFVGSDNQGLYGIEYQYNDYLTGVDGKIITAKNGLGQDMPYDYEQYIEPQNGYTLVLTIDYTIQSILEKYLEECLEESGADNRVTGVIMDPKTGGILAMATKPDFDCNDPYTLDEKSQRMLEECEYEKGSEKYLEYNTTLLMQMWKNKPINDLYEPGSTFKPITCSIALEETLVSHNTSFYCPGYHIVEGYGVVRCHKTEGHGALTFDLGLQQSCNPVMMMTAEKIGDERFYDYYEAYGYTGLTGIDLPGEAAGIYHSRRDFNNVELAVYSFGQTFKTTAIQQLTAVSSLANDGNLVTPHLVKRIEDDNGNVIMDFETDVKRQVVSSRVANEIMDVLEEGVANKLGSSNAGVKGYKVAAKTGTSEKRDKKDKNGEYSLRVASCISIAPADDAAVSMIVIVDEPTLSREEGSMIAAPYNRRIMSEVLPYLGYVPEYSADDAQYKSVSVGNYAGMSVSAAQEAVKKLGLDVEVTGDGGTVRSQMPPADTDVTVSAGKVLLYATNDVNEKTVTVPDLIGKSVEECRELITGRGLNANLTGTPSDSASCLSVRQYPEAGEQVKEGSAVTVEFRIVESDDNTLR